MRNWIAYACTRIRCNLYYYLKFIFSPFSRYFYDVLWKRTRQFISIWTCNPFAAAWMMIIIMDQSSRPAISFITEFFIKRRPSVLTFKLSVRFVGWRELGKNEVRMLHKFTVNFFYFQFTSCLTCILISRHHWSAYSVYLL